MKTLCAILFLAFGWAPLAPAQLRITDLSRGGLITWSNEICANASSVYQIIHADSPAGPWQHLTLVTNQTSLMLTGLVSTASNVFLKVGWLDHTAISLDYHFTGELCEGQGLLQLKLVPRPSGTWSFASDFCELEGHPEGEGQILLPWSTLNTNRLVLYIGEYLLDDKTWLDGIIEPLPGPSCGLRYTGLVFRETLLGSGPIGSFTAQTFP